MTKEQAVNAHFSTLEYESPAQCNRITGHLEGYMECYLYCNCDLSVLNMQETT